MQVKYSTFIAVSEDGFIADMDDEVKFLDNLSIKGDAGYQDYLSQIDGLVFGSRTYDFIIRQNIPWPYQQKSYILTSKKSYQKPSQANLEFVNIDLLELDKYLAKKGHHHIWVMGGANVINQYLAINALSYMVISVVNRKLKTGIKLFPKPNILNDFNLIKKIDFGDIINHHYIIKNNK